MTPGIGETSRVPVSTARRVRISAAASASRGECVLLDHHDRHALAAYLPDDVDRALDMVGREAERRLVEQHQPGPRHQRAADREHLLLATRERAGRLIPALGEDREAAKQAIHVGGDRAGVAAQVAAHLQVFAHRHVRKHVAPFRTVRDSARDDLLRRHSGDVLAVEPDATRRWP
jgi:hypothetical protein